MVSVKKELGKFQFGANCPFKLKFHLLFKKGRRIHVKIELTHNKSQKPSAQCLTECDPAGLLLTQNTDAGVIVHEELPLRLEQHLEHTNKAEWCQ